MSAFLWAIIAILALSAVGKIGILYNRDTVRNLVFVPFDLVIDIGLLVWAARLLP